MAMPGTYFIHSGKFACKKIFLFFLLNSTLLAFAQKVQTGIYELDYNTDAGYIHQFIPAHNEQGQDQNIKNVYNHKYVPLFDEHYGIQYAIVIKKEDQENKESYNLEIILLNKKIIDGYGVSYSDTWSRKYLSFDVVIGFSTDYWYKSTPISEGFLEYYNPDDDSESPAYQSDGHNFYKSSDSFFLKSHRYKTETDSAAVDSASYVSNPPYRSYYAKRTIYTTIKQAVAAFRLKEAKSYRSILPIQTEGVKLYTSANEKDTNDFRILNRGDFIAVTAETDEWYYGEYISVTGEVTAGKIFIDDLLKSELKQKKINGLTLKIRYLLHDRQDWGDEGEITGIKIYSQNKLIQVIKKPGLINDVTNIIASADVNFDGFQDIIVYEQSGGAGPNNSNNYYVFNPKTKKFIFNEKLSSLSQPGIDPKTKTVYAAWRNGAANHGSEKYKWIKGKLVLVEYYELYFLDELNVEETHTVLKNGKMVGKTKKTKAGSLKPPF